jgi:hypothetical protein
MTEKVAKKPKVPAGTVTITVESSTQTRLDLKLSVARKKGAPEVVQLSLSGREAARAFSVLNDPTLMDPDWKPTLLTDPKVAPKVGDIVYVRTSMYIDHGEDDVVGGLAHVEEVKYGTSAGKPTPFVTVREHPGRGYNWEMLAVEQERLAKDFGSKWAYPDPER